MPARRVLILSASVGAGHLRAASALEEAVRRIGDCEVRNTDVLERTSALYRRAYVRSYVTLIQRNPELWGYLYRATDRERAREDKRSWIELYDKMEFAGLRRMIRHFAPDVVLATHFLAGQVLAPARRQGRDRFVLGMVVTDFTAHSMWLQKTADLHFVASEELRAILAGRGIEEERVHATGIPVSARFGTRASRRRRRAALGLDGEARVVLVMGGGEGLGSVETAVEAALGIPHTAVLAVAGRNEELRAALERRAAGSRGRLRVFGFSETIEELMGAADLVVTKSGGLTSSECLALGLPMVVLDPIPGQEERNCDHLLEVGAALKTSGPASLTYKLQWLLRDERKLLAMARAARAAGRPEAADRILEISLAEVGRPARPKS